MPTTSGKLPVFLSVIAILVSIVALVPTLTSYLGFQAPGASREAQSRAWDYFSAWQEGDIVSLEAMEGRAAPDSPAYQWAAATYQAWHTWSWAQHGQAKTPKYLLRKTKNYTISRCPSDKKQACTVYSGFSFNSSSGLITDFSVDGVPVRGHVMAEQAWTKLDAKNSGGTVWFRMMGARSSNSGGLDVVIQIQNESSHSIRFSQTNYQDFDNNWHPKLSVEGRTLYSPDVEGLMWVNVPHQDLTGYLVLSYTSSTGGPTRQNQWFDMRS